MSSMGGGCSFHCAFFSCVSKGCQFLRNDMSRDINTTQVSWAVDWRVVWGREQGPYALRLCMGSARLWMPWISALVTLNQLWKKKRRSSWNDSVPNTTADFWEIPPVMSNFLGHIFQKKNCKLDFLDKTLQVKFLLCIFCVRFFAS